MSTVEDRVRSLGNDDPGPLDLDRILERGTRRRHLRQAGAVVLGSGTFAALTVIAVSLAPGTAPVVTDPIAPPDSSGELVTVTPDEVLVPAEEVSPVPAERWAATQVACLAAKGFDAYAEAPDTVRHIPPAPELQEEYNRAAEECRQRHPSVDDPGSRSDQSHDPEGGVVVRDGS